ncbi:MAG TPA: GTP cyclohydrolase II [Methylophilaceae bacterium]|nr:GTP cyclohydrolase II [Methylophilaceae bacterium]
MQQTPETALPDAAIPNQTTLEYKASCNLPTPWATFRLHGFVDSDNGKEHLAITLGEFPSNEVTPNEPTLVRVHSECLTGDALFSQRCDCGEQLKNALKYIANAGQGMVLYMRQEGRGIGLINKIRAYELQELGADTVEANEQLGFAADMRNYDHCVTMLKHFGIQNIRLITNNPLKISALENAGITVSDRIALVSTSGVFNRRYLDTKVTKFGHSILRGLTE